jgi:pimeloyl-ACP methyl ester carboxylesterase
MSRTAAGERFQQQISVRDGQLAVHVKVGLSPALVFLHYWGGSHRTFFRTVSALASTNAVITFDQRGWGQARNLPGPYDIHQLADDVVDVVSGLALESFLLIGHSMGGKVAQLVASRKPNGLRGLVLVAPAPPRPNVGPEMVERRSHAYDTRRTVSEAIDRALTHVPLHVDLREQVLTDSLGAGREATLSWPLHGLIEDITDAARQIEVPVVVLAGQHDRVDSAASLTADLLPFIPQACLSVIDGVGHLSPLEVPEAVACHIDAFVQNLEPFT